MHSHCDGLPDALFRFVIDELKVMNVPVTEMVVPFIKSICHEILMFIDVCMPYAIFDGFSDMNFTNDWKHHAYEIEDEYGSREEVDPSQLDVFITVPNQAEKFLNYAYQNKTMEAFYSVSEGCQVHYGQSIMEALFEVDYSPFYSEGVMRCIQEENPACWHEVQRLCSGKEDLFKWYVELIAWGTFTWIMGPYGRTWRSVAHPVFAEAYCYRDWDQTPREIIMYEGDILHEGTFIKMARPPYSCQACEEQVWCVNWVEGQKHKGFVCESCGHGGSHSYTKCSLGCPDTGCHNHPQYGQNPLSYRNQHGQLAQKARKQYEQISGKPIRQVNRLEAKKRS